jgi:hypothetical protein
MYSYCTTTTEEEEIKRFNILKSVSGLSRFLGIELSLEGIDMKFHHRRKHQV